jgi:hypothetical protein
MENGSEKQRAAMDSPRHVLPEVPSNNLITPDSFEDEIDDETPPLQYARSNGLARDHLADQLVFSELSNLQTSVPHGLTDGGEICQFNFGEELKVEERVTISREGAQLLSSVAQQETAEGIDVILLPMVGARGIIKKARLELPLLRSDHEADCQNFARRDDFEIKLRDIKLPLEIVSDDKNEGLVWPGNFSSLGAERLEELKQEKINVSKDHLLYLQNALKHSWTEEDDKNLWIREQKYKRVGG